MIEKGPKGRFFAPDKLDNPGTSEGKGKKKRRKSEEKRTGGEEKKAMVALLVFIMAIHGYSGPDPNLEIRGGQSSRPFEKSGGRGEGVGGLQKTFRPFGPQFGLKIGPPPPGSATAVLEMVLVEKLKNCLKEGDIWQLSFLNCIWLGLKIILSNSNLCLL